MKIYNTLTRQKEIFTPLENNKVKMYVCGPTVYNYVHIGNARVSVFFDVVRRYFEYIGYEVIYVQNITDVDDKIIKTSKETGIPELEISNEYTKKYNMNLSDLNVLFPHVQPKVSEHIPQIISFIEKLIEKGMAYEKNGDVYYRVERFKDYGKLTNQSLSSLQHTKREIVEKIDYKENEFDFALWKKQKADEISWDSPWGKGRPGWHIECSAMSMTYLGETFDIHGGGLDLCFPHHENEIAQSEGLTDKPFANYWLHNNYVTVEGQKMSKSVGNFTTVQDSLKKYDGNTLRFFYLSVNYRNPIDYSETALEQSKAGLNRIQNTIDNLYHLKTSKIEGTVQRKTIEMILSFINQFKNYMEDDFDTASVITLLFETSKQVNTLLDQNELNSQDAKNLLDLFDKYGNILGLKLLPALLIAPIEIEEMIKRRDDLKIEAKNAETKEEKIRLFQEADSIRESLKQMGVILEDTINGTRWKIAKEE